MIASFLFYALVGQIVVCVVLAIRVFVMAPASRRSARPLVVCVVLGSGGHTSEMFDVLRCLPRGMWADNRPFYVVSATDRDSAGIADDFEKTFSRHCKICIVPRAREVGQSYITSIFSTIRSLFSSIRVVYKAAPDVILTNGPGVCVPVVAAGYFVSAALLRRRPAVAYFESFACVDHLSASGTILRCFVDVFTVQWDKLKNQLGAGVFYTGPFTADRATLPRRRISPTGRKRQVLVTVGSTKFDALMQAVDTTEFFALMKERGIQEIIVQKGRSSYDFQIREGAFGVKLTIFDYKPFLKVLIREVALVISHAGAGTILEAMASRTPMVVVPNMLLMSNHQLQLAQALSEHKSLAFCTVDKLTECLAASGGAALEELEEFPPVNTAAWEHCFRLLLNQN